MDDLELIEYYISKSETLIDEAAENALKKYVKYNSAQFIVSLEKSEEAKDYIAGNYPEDLSNYPFIKEETMATNKTSKQVADDIISKKSEWVAISSKIEGERLRGKTNVRNMKDKKDIGKEELREVMMKSITIIRNL